MTRAPVNKALLIGIQYEANKDFENLLLAHKDAGMVKDMLISEFQFSTPLSKSTVFKPEQRCRPLSLRVEEHSRFIGR